MPSMLHLGLALLVINLEFLTSGSVFCRPNGWQCIIAGGDCASIEFNFMYSVDLLLALNLRKDKSTAIRLLFP